MPPLPLDLNDAFRSLTGGSFSEFYAEISPYFPLAVAGVIVWGLWLYRFILSHRAGPILTDFRASTSVVVPSFHEDPEILMSALESWRAQKPDEIIIVLDVEDLDAYHRIVALGDDTIRPVLFHHVGKRSALGVGMRMARFDILVLTDSDTWWQPELLTNVQMPFEDPTVGAVGTHQTVYQRDSSVWRRIADWLVNVRYLDYVPAMGRAGAVPCISGRTAVYRRSAVMGLIEHLENEFFMGRRCIFRRRRTAHLAGARLRLQDRPPVLGTGTVHVPCQLPGLHEAAHPLEPQFVPLLPHGGGQGLAVAGAVRDQSDRPPDHPYAGDHGTDDVLPDL